jgi:acetyltransferase
MALGNLNALFRPNSVAIVGAADEPGNVGLEIMGNIRAGRFLGPVMPLDPDKRPVMGVESYRDVDTLPLTPDLAVICSPPDDSPAWIRAFGRRGAKGAIVLCPGYAKLPREQKNELQAKMLEAARSNDIRLIGPSGMGVQTPLIGLNASLSETKVKPGKTAFLSQSASLFATVLDWAKSGGIGFSYMVSLGDAVDVGFAEIIDFLSSDAHTRSILLYIDAITDARNFMSAARAAARNKPVLVIKPGRKLSYDAASQSMVSRGLDEVYGEAFRRAGMLRVPDIDTLFDAASTLVRTQPIKGERLAILTNGGSIGIMAADALLDAGGRLAAFTEETKRALEELLGRYWFRQGVVDLSFDSSPETCAEAVAVLLRDKQTNAVLLINVPFAGVAGVETARAVIAKAAKSNRPLLTCWMGFQAAEPARALFNEAGIPTYETPEKAIRAFMNMVEHRRNQELLMEMPRSMPAGFVPDANRAREVIAAALAEGRGELTEPEAKAVLAAYAIPVVDSRLAGDAKQAAAAAEELGFPVAVKLSSPDIPQPFDVGGIELDLETPSAVAEAVLSIMGRALKLRPKAKVAGFIVQRMGRIAGAAEVSLAAEVDPVFGPFVRFGLGGMAGRRTRDKAVALPPLNMGLARELISRTRVSKMLEGFAGQPGADIDKLCLALVQLSQLITDLGEVTGIELNPVLAGESGVLVIGARMRVARTEVPGSERLAVRPYPSELEECVKLRDGRKLLLRPIRPEDETSHYEFFSHLSPEDLRYRFFGIVRELSHQEMAKLTQIDYEREMAFVATTEGDGGAPETLGEVRAASRPDNSSAEFAIIIRSDGKGQGLGTILMDKIIRYCRARGTLWLTGQALLDNQGMQGLARKMGFHVHKDADDEVVEMRLQLNAGGKE